MAAVGCPMVVLYRLNPLSYRLARRWVTAPYISLPNLLGRRSLVPEFVQRLRPTVIEHALRGQMARGDEHRAELVKIAVALRGPQRPHEIAADEVERWLN